MTSPSVLQNQKRIIGRLWAIVKRSQLTPIDYRNKIKELIRELEAEIEPFDVDDNQNTDKDNG